MKGKAPKPAKYLNSNVITHTWRVLKGLGRRASDVGTFSMHLVQAQGSRLQGKSLPACESTRAGHASVFPTPSKAERKYFSGQNKTGRPFSQVNWQDTNTHVHRQCGIYVPNTSLHPPKKPDLGGMRKGTCKDKVAEAQFTKQ